MILVADVDVGEGCDLKMGGRMSHLFSAGTLGPLSVKNRVVMPPMCLFQSDDGGMPNEFHRAHYLMRAINGVGLIIVEATAVSREGRITATDLGLWEDAQVAPLADLVRDCQKYGARMGVQLAHAGSKSADGQTVNFSCSAVQADEKYALPQEMSLGDIRAFVNDMRASARRACEAGFDLIEIHAAHGYLINQFLSPVTNERTDEYGGSLEKRARLLMEVVAAIREVVSCDVALILRISAREYMEDGYSERELAQVVNLVKDKLDGVNVSTGGVIRKDRPQPKLNLFSGHQIEPAETIRELTGLTTIAGGLVNEASMANDIVAEGKADFVFIGRGLLVKDNWCIRAQESLQDEVEYPKSYAGAYATYH